MIDYKQRAFILLRQIERMRKHMNYLQYGWNLAYPLVSPKITSKIEIPNGEGKGLCTWAGNVMIIEVGGTLTFPSDKKDKDE